MTYFLTLKPKRMKLSAIPIALAAICVFSACKDDDPETVKAPTLRLEQDEITVPGMGGGNSIRYTLTDPVPGAELTLGYDRNQQWIEFDLTTPGVIAFTAKKNETADPRELAVEVNYPGIQETPSFTIRQTAEQATIELALENVVKRAFWINIFPSDKTMHYLFFSKSAEIMAQFPDDTALVDSDFQYFIFAADASDMPLRDYIASEASIGDRTEAWNCEPGGDYVVYAYGIDLETLEVLTPVTKLSVRSDELDQVDFGITVTVNDHRATVEVTPTDPDRYYFADAFLESDIDQGVKFSKYCSDAWNSKVQGWQVFDNLTEEQILEQHCKKGPGTFEFELLANSDYRLAVFALDEKAWLCSEPIVENFRTGSTAISDNVIQISVSKVASRSAEVTFTPTTSDPYVSFVTDSAPFEGMSDEEIIAYCAKNLPPRWGTTGYSNTFAPLVPGTKYYVLAYGCYYNGDVTTGLFKEEFTTTDRVGSVSFELQFGPYYDLWQLADADPDTGWHWSAEMYDCLLPVEVVKEDVKGLKYRYALYTKQVIDGLSEDELYKTLYEHGADYSPNYFLSDYNLEFVLSGFAIDDRGDWGPIWKSEPFTLKADGVSDPHDYLRK